MTGAQADGMTGAIDVIFSICKRSAWRAHHIVARDTAWLGAAEREHRRLESPARVPGSSPRLESPARVPGSSTRFEYPVRVPGFEYIDAVERTRAGQENRSAHRASGLRIALHGKLGPPRGEGEICWHVTRNHCRRSSQQPNRETTNDDDE